MRSLLLVVTLLAGCAGESSWTIRDRHGWPAPTWARMDGYPAYRDTCLAGARGATASPDSVSARVDAQALACGTALPGWHARAEMRLYRVNQAARHRGR